VFLSLLRHSAVRLRLSLAIRRPYRSDRQKDRPQARGLRLLRAWLSAEQLAQFETRGHFDVIGAASGKRYRIHFGVSANVQEIGEDGSPTTGWCFGPEDALVPGDVMLAQKVALETSEYAALAVANRFPVATPRRRRGLHRPF
jgi:hypothetical protein